MSKRTIKSLALAVTVSMTFIMSAGLVLAEEDSSAAAGGALTDLLLEDSAHWMDDKFSFDVETKDYDLDAWLETYGVRFTPVVTGSPDETVMVTMSGAGMDETTKEVHNGEQFVLNMTQEREASNPEGNGERGIEDDCAYTVTIQASNGTYTLDITRPGLQQYVDQFERRTFDMSTVKDAEEDKEQTYWLHVPDDYDESKTYPVVLYLHGVGQRGNEAADILLRNASATTFAYYGKDCIVVAPQCNYSDLSAVSSWATEEMDVTIFGEGAYQILQGIKDEFNIDNDRTYIIGLSMGGQGTSGMLATYPQEWAGAIIGAAPFQFGENGLANLTSALKLYNIPVWFAYAKDDDSVDFSASHDVLVPAMDEMGINYKLTLFLEDSYLAPMRHFCWAPMWANEEAIDWLLAQSKSGNGELNELLLEDSALGATDIAFTKDQTTYDLTVWEETYGIRFTPVIGGDKNSTVEVTMSGSGIEETTQTVKKNETFELLLTQNRAASNPEGTGIRGMEDDCTYTVSITDAQTTYTINVTRPGIAKFLSDEEWGYTTPGEEYFTKETFALNQLPGYESEEHSMYYWLHVPSDYDETKEYPIIMYTHGSGQKDNRADDIFARNTIASAFLSIDGIEDCIIVAPQANYTDLSNPNPGWSSGAQTLNVLGEGAYGILKQTIEQYSVDTNRVYLVGLSMGSTGASAIITNHGREGLITAALLDIDPTSNNTVGAEKLAAALADTKLPVWYFMHERDANRYSNGGYNVPSYRPFVDLKLALFGKDHNCRITVFPYTTYLQPTTHFSWAAVYSNPVYLNWLLAQSK